MIINNGSGCIHVVKKYNNDLEAIFSKNIKTY